MAVLELSFESKERSLSVRKFAVHEGISKLYDVAIVARSPNEDVDLEALVGQGAGFLVVSSLLVPRVWTGICSHAEQIKVEQPGPASLGLSTYFLRIVPTMWLLTQRKGNRIFQNTTIPAIVEKILGEYQIKPKMQVTEPHPEHDYRVQYGETDFAFICRLMEEEGISYIFEQIQGDSGQKTQLVLTDRPQGAKARSAIRYTDQPNPEGIAEYVTEVHVGHDVRPGRYTIRDYDFLKPDYRLVGAAEKAPAPEDLYEQYRYEHGAFTDDKGGKIRADVSLQAHRTSKRRVHFRTNAYDVAPGTVLSFDRHPRNDLASDKTLLVTSASLEGTSQGDWRLDAEAHFADVPYRPQQTTPKPRISGVQSAIVVGPKGEEIYTDEYGRVRVQFHWDRDGEYTDKSSCWIRVSHGWAGGAYGMIAIPRIGQEVLVSFWEGNPDEPVIVGRVYNNKTRVPYALPEHKTRSTWKSDSSPKSAGFNEIMFEDKAGSEQVYIQAQRDLSKLVKRNETERTGANRTIVVGANRSSVIGAIDTTLVGAKYSVAMVQPKEMNILKGGEPDVSPQKTMIEMVEGKIILTTGEATITLEGPTITLKADGDIKIKAGGEVVIHGGPMVKINC